MKWELIDFKRIAPQIKQFEYKPIFAIVIGSIVFYMIQYSKFVDIHGNLHHLWTDPLYYVRVGNILNATGIETTAGFFPSYASMYKPTFGHYFESWNSAFFSWLFNISGVYAMMLIYFPITFSTVYIGAVALTKKYTTIESDFLIYILAYMIIVIAPIRALATPVANFLGFATTNKYNLIYNTVQKFSIIYIFFIWFFIEFKRSKNLGFIFPLLLIGVIYPVTLPGIYGSVLLYLIILYLKNNSKTEHLIVFFSSILLLLSFIAFYYFNREIAIQNNDNISLVSVIKKHIIDPSFYIYQLTDPFKKFLMFLISFAPYLILLILLKKPIVKIVNIKSYLLFLLLIIPLLGYNIIYYIWDADQIFSNVFTPITNIVLFIVLVLIVQLRKTSLIVYVFILFMLNIGQTLADKDFKESTYIIYEDEYTDLIKDIKSRKNPSFAIIADSSYRFFQNPSWSLQRISNHVFVENISWNISPLSTNKKIVISDNNTFYRFVYNNNLLNNIPFAQLKFLREAKVDYLIAHKNTKIDNPIMEFVDKTYNLPTQQMTVYRLKLQ
ncbi:MAG: hypothetical protein WCP85_11305 [Mariniphaga sp.]